MLYADPFLYQFSDEERNDCLLIFPVEWERGVSGGKDAMPPSPGLP